MPGHGCLCCCCCCCCCGCFCEGAGGWPLVGGGLLVWRGGDPPFPPSSTFLVKQHRPFPGQVTLLSISSQSNVKKPETQVPRHPLKLSCFCSVRCVGVVRLVVGNVVVAVGVGVVWAGADALDGDTSSRPEMSRNQENTKKMRNIRKKLIANIFQNWKFVFLLVSTSFSKHIKYLFSYGILVYFISVIVFSWFFLSGPHTCQGKKCLWKSSEKQRARLDGQVSKINWNKLAAMSSVL